MIPPLAIVDVAPVGTQTGPAFVCSSDHAKSGLQMLTMPTYPPSPIGRALRTTRHRLDLTLGDAGRVLGIRAERVSALEMGRATLSDREWLRVFCALAEEWERRHPPTVINAEGAGG